ncbi:MAG: hypothetical protein AB1679_06465 [Actinomycetota bacterium]
MSKRSYRRLAVVAGAALALGSMAPAMAQRSNGGDADADADASVEVTLPDLSDLGLSLGDLSGLVSVGNIAALNNLAINDVTAIVNVLGLNVGDISADVLDTVNVGDITANALGAATVNVSNVLNAGTANVANVTATVGDVTATVGDVSANVLNVASVANVGDITANVGDILSGNTIGGGLLGLPGLLDGGLDGILDLSGEASINVLASLLASL